MIRSSCPARYGKNKTKEPNLGGQNRPSAEENCLDWRALERRGIFRRERKGSRSPARAGLAEKLQEAALKSSIMVTALRGSSRMTTNTGVPAISPKSWPG